MDEMKINDNEARENNENLQERALPTYEGVSTLYSKLIFCFRFGILHTVLSKDY